MYATCVGSPWVFLSSAFLFPFIFPLHLIDFDMKMNAKASTQNCFSYVKGFFIPPTLNLIFPFVIFFCFIVAIYLPPLVRKFTVRDKRVAKQIRDTSTVSSVIIR